ncbi:MAG: Fic family protein [Deltaproteobacteria bacterium]|jgi:Fic family protein|nr:Fic family protein [Deltaproteobacteria bacterium]
MPLIARKWEPITDIPDNFSKLSDPVFAETASAWEEARKSMDKKLISRYRETVFREWAIETGLIEGLYRVDASLKESMIRDGLDTADLLNATKAGGVPDVSFMIANHYVIVKNLVRDFGPKGVLPPLWVRRLHSRFMRKQDYYFGVLPSGRRGRSQLLKGVFKRRPNNLFTPNGVIEFCPPSQVIGEMDRLIAMHKAHVEAKVPVDVEAAWLHHRFALIHPFQAGNGRVGRALASLEYMRAGFLPPVISAVRKTEYIEALNLAGKGDLKPFVGYLSGVVISKIQGLIDSAKSEKCQQ